MLRLLAAFAVVSVPASVGAAHEVDLDERRPIAVVLELPDSEATGASVSDIVRLMDEVLESRTDLAAQWFDGESPARECGGRITCIVRAIRTDYDRERLVDPNGRLQSYADHVSGRPEGSYARLLLYLRRVQSGGGRDNLVAVLVDTDVALDAWHRGYRAGPDWESAVESRVRREVLVATSALESVTTPQNLRRFLSELYTVRFRSLLERAGHFDARASITVETSAADVAVELDGTPVAVTTASSEGGRVRLSGLQSGERRVVLRHPDFEPYAKTVRVDPGAQVTVEHQLVQRQSAARGALVWGSVAAMAGGTAIAIAAGAAAASSSPTHYCVGGGPQLGTCPSGSFLTLPSESSTVEDPAGILVAPLGYSLAAAGGVALLTAWLTDDTTSPWVSALVGIAGGAVVYGVSALANPNGSIPTE